MSPVLQQARQRQWRRRSACEQPPLGPGRPSDAARAGGPAQRSGRPPCATRSNGCAPSRFLVTKLSRTRQPPVLPSPGQAANRCNPFDSTTWTAPWRRSGGVPKRTSAGLMPRRLARPTGLGLTEPLPNPARPFAFRCNGARPAPANAAAARRRSDRSPGSSAPRWPAREPRRQGSRRCGSDECRSRPCRWRRRRPW